MTSIHSEADYYDKKPNRWFHETYDGRHVIIPVGLSVQWNCCDKTIVGLDMQGNYLRTDNVDVVNNPDFTNKYFDKYGTLSFSLRYKIL